MNYWLAETGGQGGINGGIVKPQHLGAAAESSIA